MESHERIDLINTKEDLADFVGSLRSDLHSSPSDWGNQTLDCYFESMEAWIRAMEYAYENMGEEFPRQPSWKMIADILYAAKVYE
jgi:hypothetical protein